MVGRSGKAEGAFHGWVLSSARPCATPGLSLGDVPSRQPIGIVLTVLGVVILDFSADATEGPIRAYLLDVVDSEEQDMALNIHAFSAGERPASPAPPRSWGVMGGIHAPPRCSCTADAHAEAVSRAPRPVGPGPSWPAGQAPLTPSAVGVAVGAGGPEASRRLA